MRDYATKSYYQERSDGLSWLVGILVVLFSLAYYIADRNLTHPEAAKQYKWMDRNGQVQCKVRLEESGPLFPCSKFSPEELNKHFLEWRDPTKPAIKA